MLGVALVVFGSLVLLKFPDRPGGKIEFKGLSVDSKGAGLPIIALGVIAVAMSAIGVPTPDPNQDGPTTTIKGQLTKQEYIRQGDVICAQYRRQAEEIGERFESASVAEYQSVVFELISATRAFASRFKDLRAPPEDKAVADRLAANLDQQVGKLGQIVTSALQQDIEGAKRAQRELATMAREFRELAEQYGFEECSK